MGKKVRVRSFVIGGLFTLLFVVMTLKLYWVQVVEGAALLSKAEDSWNRQVVLQPIRGTITDRDGNIMAQDGQSFTVAVNPGLIDKYKTQDEVVSMLAPLLNMNTPEGIQKLKDRVTAKRENGTLMAQVEIRNEGWKIDKTVADQIRDKIESHQLYGVYLLEERKRYYPTNQLAAHVLGYVDKENVARTGLEAYYDNVLSGKPGKISYEKDRLGYQLPNAQATVTPPENGNHIRLTIDRNIQHYVEEALDKMTEQFHPKAAMVIAADPNTMEILGMANVPTYNPNTYWDFADLGDFINRDIASQYEPGSTFKIVTLAGAVEQGIFKPEEKYKSGSIVISGQTIGDHNNRQGWGEITYLDGLKRSSNVAFIKLGYEGLGEAKLRSYIEKFGFGQQTGIDLPGEIDGLINFRYPTEVATAAFGQGKVSVTAIQQVAAVAAIANGGKLMKPYIMKEIIDSKTNKVLSTTEPEVVRQVISESAARQVNSYLEQVVSDQKIGTGRRAYIEGYRIAGKTGTAQKVVNGEYADDKWVVSYIGYAPADDPKIVLCVIVDEPDIGGDYRRGSEVSAPVFKEIMGKSLRYFGVAKSNTSFGVMQLKDSSVISMPDMNGKSISEAGDLLSRNEINYDVLGSGKTVLQHLPQAGVQIGAEQRVFLLTQAADSVAFPDLTARSLRDAVEVCSLLEADCTFTGEGYVSSQRVNNHSPPFSVDVVLEPYYKEESAEINRG